jgi:hypothetical protein
VVGWITRLSKQIVHVFEFCDDVDVRLAGRDAITACDAGGPVLGKRFVFGFRP